MNRTKSGGRRPADGEGQRFVESDGNPGECGKNFGLDKTKNLWYDNKKIKIEQKNHGKSGAPLKAWLVPAPVPWYNTSVMPAFAATGIETKERLE